MNDQVKSLLPNIISLVAGGRHLNDREIAYSIKIAFVSHILFSFSFFFGSDIKEYRMLFIVSQCHFSNTVVMGTTVHIDGRHDNGLPNNLDDFYGIRMTKGSKIMLD